MILSKQKCIRAAAIAALIIPTTTYAVVAGDPTVLPGSTQVGQPAWGSDHWTQAMTQLGLFRVHRDDCASATEVFVEVFADDNSVQFGFCIDKDEHSAGSVEWEDARQECLDDGKRLPEPFEYKHACQNATGLNNMTDDYEFGSNFPFHLIGSSNQGLGVIGIGGGSCTKAGTHWTASLSGLSTSSTFRCVR